MTRYQIRPGRRVHLDRYDPRDTAGYKGTKADALRESRKLLVKLEKLQELLYADHSRKVLVVLEGLDTSGKDGTIRHVFEGVNPQGVRVHSFRSPTPDEVDHDFLWRAHQQAPGNGEIVIFNRSHYEDVLVVRVDNLVPKSVWRRRYRQINEFERYLTEEGTTVLKFYLHISKLEQKKRLQERLADPTKHWKFSRSDLLDRRRWPQFMAAYEEMLEKTSTDWAPWYLIPSDNKWFRNLLVSGILVKTLGKLDLRWPSLPPEFNATAIH
jgi:PPK2 family polyphosphate:nucleotide phosphotransferase